MHVTPTRQRPDLRQRPRAGHAADARTADCGHGPMRTGNASNRRHRHDRPGSAPRPPSAAQTREGGRHPDARRPRPGGDHRPPLRGLRAPHKPAADAARRRSGRLRRPRAGCAWRRPSSSGAERWPNRRGRNRCGDPRKTAAYLIPRYGSLPVEHIGALLLDTRNRILEGGDVVLGPRSPGRGAGTPPRDVLRAVLRSASRSFVLWHNHPSGDPTPSEEDAAITERNALRGRDHRDRAARPRHRHGSVLLLVSGTRATLRRQNETHHTHSGRRATMNTTPVTKPRGLDALMEDSRTPCTAPPPAGREGCSRRWARWPPGSGAA